MKVGEAREIARRWVVEEASKLAGFEAAFLSGSVAYGPDEAEHAATSDVDMMVLFAGEPPAGKPGKFAYDGVLLEVSFGKAEEFRSAEALLGNYHRAGAFRRPNVLVDRTGALTALQEAVSREFAKRSWVRRRCEHARDHGMRYLRGLTPELPLYMQANACAFGGSIPTHVLLVAGLRNPTVRKRYVAARELLQDCGRAEFHETLLDGMGCREMSADDVRRHLVSMTEAFDEAKTVVSPSYIFASDINDAARVVPVDGSRALIDEGLHREAVFWITATHARCQNVLLEWGTEEQQARHAAGFMSLLEDLGIGTYEQRRRRCEEVAEELLPRVWEVAEEIMSENGEIEG